MNYYRAKDDTLPEIKKNAVLSYIGNSKEGAHFNEIAWENGTYTGKPHVLPIEGLMDHLEQLDDTHPLFRDMLSDIERHDLIRDEAQNIYTVFQKVYVIGDRPHIEVHELDEANMCWMQPTLIDPLTVRPFNRDTADDVERLALDIANFGGLPEPER